ncbi:MAG TPA: trypsin-like peptidase domain-containing protein [Bosea sp. (in: a-proteobacteria)]
MNLAPFSSTFDFSSLVAVRIETRSETNKVIETGTGFWFRPSREALYLVTNWHVVTGRKPQTPSLSSSGAIPTKLVARVHHEVGPGEINPNQIAELTLPLNDPTGEAPQWLEHPTLRHRADVVALRVENIERFETLAIRAIGDEDIFDRTPKYIPQVMHDVFVLGYPWGLAGGTPALPIYKKGSIASEPGLSQGGLPRFLIDCRSARGMSGSPVIASAQVTGAVGKGDEPLLWANAKVFAGIYSGRLTEDELQSESTNSASLRAEALAAISEIGIVWRRDVLFELIAAPTPGTKLSEI